jgi:hypothetical protein
MISRRLAKIPVTPFQLGQPTRVATESPLGAASHAKHRPQAVAAPRRGRRVPMGVAARLVMGLVSLRPRDWPERSVRVGRLRTPGRSPRLAEAVLRTASRSSSGSSR